MAIVSCPECSKKLKVADTSVGKKVKCSCGNVFVAEASNGAAVKLAMPVAATDKPTVACSECGAKLKVAASSLGKKMKCPKCAGVFVAVAEEAPPLAKPIKPAPKAKPHAAEEEDDPFTFADQEEEYESKPKGKHKQPEPVEEEEEDDWRKGLAEPEDEPLEDEDLPKPKAKLAHKGPPPRPGHGGEKPKYPSRILVNLFVFFLLALFLGAFTVVYLELYPLGLPMPRILAEKTKTQKEREDKERRIKAAAQELEGDWVVQSAVSKGAPWETLIGHKIVIGDGKFTGLNLKDIAFSVEADHDPMWIDLMIPEKAEIPGIFKIDGDALKLCLASPNIDTKIAPERPKDFADKNGVMLVLKKGKGDNKVNNKIPDKGKDKESDKDKEKIPVGAAKLDGAWKVEAAERKGEPDKRSVGDRFVFGTDGKITFPDGMEGTYKLDSAKSPMWLDLNIPKLGDVPGLAKFEGDFMHWALAFPDKDGNPSPRPKSFDSKAGMLITLKRAGKEDAKAPVVSHRISQNNLKQMALAMMVHADANKNLPAHAISDPTGKPLLSWRVAILPYIEEIELYQEFDRTKPWDDPHNKKLIAKMPKLYVVPGTDAKTGKTHYRVLVGPGTIFELQKGPDGMLVGKRFPAGLPDGTSNCIMIVEAKDAIEWTRPDDLPYDPKGPLPKFGVGPDGFNAVFADGHVELISPKVPEGVLRPYLTCNNGIPRQPLDSGEAPNKGKKGSSNDKDKDFDKESFKPKGKVDGAKGIDEKPKGKDDDKKKADDQGKVNAAKAQLLVLNAAVRAYALKNADQFPEALKDLVEGGERFVESEDALLDPWKKSFQYDRNGKKTDGARPDIWTVTPAGVTIGNWRDEKK